MPWTQNIDPLGNPLLSAGVAVIPIVFIFWAMIIRRMKVHHAAWMATAITIIIAITVYKMPAMLALFSVMHGAAYGLFPICWIIIPAVFLYNLTVKAGQFNVIRYYMGSITEDQRIQALLIAFSFGAFLEGTAGFGTPVAITAAMLVGLGFQPLYAAGICLIANTAPVAFGSIGIPITVASQVSGIPELAISQMVGRTLPLLSLITPWYLVLLMCGWKKTVDIWPALLVSGGSFALVQWFTANYIGPTLPDILAAIASIVALVLFLRVWKPDERWKVEGGSWKEAYSRYSPMEVVKALSPFLILTVMVLFWGLPPVKRLLTSLLDLKIAIPGLHEQIIGADDQQPIPQWYRFSPAAAAGTAVLMACILSVIVLRIRITEAGEVLRTTLKQLTLPIITIATILGFAYLFNNAGLSLTLANVLTETGTLFPFFSPWLGWLGVFITGSDTSSNALFGKLQSRAAEHIGMDPVIAVGANISGGVVGKMISPQSIAVAAAAGNLVGKESDLFRFTMKHSFILLIIISILTVLQTFVFTWIIPSY
ncbi:MAG: lactate permease LctP family transporter [Chitinophagaceae bacterium]